MRILGIDYGDKRIGLAVSDRLQLTAQALGVYTVTDEDTDKTYFLQLVDRYNVEKIVLGLDARDGKIATRGWTETGETTVMESFKRGERRR